MEETPKTQALIASADETACQTVSYVLDRNGYAAKLMHDGQEVIAEVAAGDYGLVFLDLALPNVSGMQVFQVIRNIPDLRIAIMAGGEKPLAAMVKAAKDKGAFGPLPLPVIPARVEELLREMEAAGKQG